MNRLLRRVLQALQALMLVCAGLLAWQLHDYWRLDRTERELAAARLDASAVSFPSAEFALARAQTVVRRGGTRAGDAALDLYRQVEAEGSPELRRIARYDTANLYLRQAQDELARGEPGRAVPLIELAKGIYRGLLSDDASEWDVRYNLERAIRLLPEEDPDATELIQAAPENMESAPTTMRGTSMGMP
jgi:mxaK protein